LNINSQTQNTCNLTQDMASTTTIVNADGLVKGLFQYNEPNDGINFKFVAWYDPNEPNGQERMLMEESKTEEFLKIVQERKYADFNMEFDDEYEDEVANEEAWNDMNDADDTDTVYMISDTYIQTPNGYVTACGDYNEYITFLRNKMVTIDVEDTATVPTPPTTKNGKTRVGRNVLIAEQVCPHCNVTFINKTSNSFATHKSRCNKNPKNIK